MSSLFALGARPQASAALPAHAQGAGKAYGAQLAPASGNVAARLPVVDPVAFDDEIVNLSAQSLQRTGQLAGDTVDAAQKLMNTFVDKLFGDQAKGASISFDSVSLEAQSSYSASATQGTTEQGSTRSAQFSLNESASFIGKGQLVTADGQSYDFEIEINYKANIQASIEASAAQTAQTAQADSIDAPDVVVLTGKPLPAIKYPGSLDDLFKLLGKELQGSLKGKDEAGDTDLGKLSLRLLRLVDRAALLAPRPQSDDVPPAPAERSRAATSYAAQAAG